MDGIFGIGLPELMIIALVLFVIGGPENSARWAREAGRQLRKLIDAWNEMSTKIEKELGPEGKELMDMSRELGRSAQEIRSIASPQNIIRKTISLSDPVESNKPVVVRPSAESAPTEKKYPAWLPPEQQQK